jgi:7-keto-8-aminopelargonate synthetase-like enzyme
VQLKNGTAEVKSVTNECPVRSAGEKLLERKSWDDPHGTYDGFVSSNPAALHRFDVRYRRDKILDHSSNEYLALAGESEKLQAKALADDDEPKY